MRDINHLFEHLKKAVETGEPFFPQEHDIDMLERYTNTSTDLISRADAIAYIDRVTNSGLGRSKSLDYIRKYISALPSADAEPTVIRSRTLMPTKDFKEWARRVREDNPNVIIIPCDAEVVSADAVQGWILCSERLPSDDEYVIVSVLDDHGDTPWKYTTVAWLCNGVWISDNDILCGTAIAWMPMPKPYIERREP